MDNLGKYSDDDVEVGSTSGFYGAGQGHGPGVITEDDVSDNDVIEKLSAVNISVGLMPDAELASKSDKGPFEYTPSSTVAKKESETTE